MSLKQRSQKIHIWSGYTSGFVIWKKKYHAHVRLFSLNWSTRRVYDGQLSYCYQITKVNKNTCLILVDQSIYHVIEQVRSPNPHGIFWPLLRSGKMIFVLAAGFRTNSIIAVVIIYSILDETFFTQWYNRMRSDLDIALFYQSYFVTLIHVGLASFLWRKKEHINDGLHIFIFYLL